MGVANKTGKGAGVIVLGTGTVLSLIPILYILANLQKFKGCGLSLWEIILLAIGLPMAVGGAGVILASSSKNRIGN